MGKTPRRDFLTFGYFCASEPRVRCVFLWCVKSPDVCVSLQSHCSVLSWRYAVEKNDSLTRTPCCGYLKRKRKHRAWTNGQSAMVQFHKSSAVGLPCSAQEDGAHTGPGCVYQHGDVPQRAIRNWQPWCSWNKWLKMFSFRGHLQYAFNPSTS